MRIDFNYSAVIPQSGQPVQQENFLPAGQNTAPLSLSTLFFELSLNFS